MVQAIVFLPLIGAILAGGAVEAIFLFRNRRPRSRLGSWAMTLQGNLSLVAVALEMHDIVRNVGAAHGLAIRAGIHVGSVVAGVIGIRKFSYDVWGDTVNTASRLESHGAPGRTHVSDTVFQRLQGRFAFEARGTIELKGRGPMNTYFLNASTP